MLRVDEIARAGAGGGKIAKIGETKLGGRGDQKPYAEKGGEKVDHQHCLGGGRLLPRLRQQRDVEDSTLEERDREKKEGRHKEKNTNWE